MVDQLEVGIYESRLDLSKAAARDVAARMKELLLVKETIAMVFAPAASATDFLDALVAESGLEWQRVHGFHLDEYVGAGKERIGPFAKQMLFGRVPFKSVSYLSPGDTPLEACSRYTALLRRQPLDIACIGIGENGHIAYNDPHVADFNDPVWVKPIRMDEISRRQTITDATFATLAEVPEMALTMTLPAICSAQFVYTVVPDLRKNRAVHDTIDGPVAPSCPASILRRHPHAWLYLDQESSNKLERRAR